MCGNVAYFGQHSGVVRVLEALYLLAYRAPDSSGLAALDAHGALKVRRAVGPAKALAAAMASEPLHAADGAVDREAMLAAHQSGRTNDRGGETLEALYAGASVGLGDFGAPLGAVDGSRLSQRLWQSLGAAALPADYDHDLVRHALRLVGANVAARYHSDGAVRRVLDEALMATDAGFADWQSAWAAEVEANVAGYAFDVAVRWFQKSFAGLAALLDDGDWGRVGGVTARALAHVVVGHGRWAMVGAVTVPNAHPISDLSETRIITENGSHNASLMLNARAEQDDWWRSHGFAGEGAVHRCENTTEVLTFEWQRARQQLDEDAIAADERGFVERLQQHGVDDAEAQALRLALWRLRDGNAHACGLYSQQRPGVLWISSHNKPIALVSRVVAGRREVMVASDVNAALMLWPGPVVDAAAATIAETQAAMRAGTLDGETGRQAIESVLDTFTIDVVFLDEHLLGGEELLARIENRVVAGDVQPIISVTQYDGTPVATAPQTMRLNPAMVGKRGFDSYTESHINEIPDIVQELADTYLPGGVLAVEAVWQDGANYGLGINADMVSGRYGKGLETLARVILIGEGSSWRDAMVAAPLFRQLLPGVEVVVYRPVEVLNLGTAINADTDLAIEISWSGTTDALLKVDSWLNERGVLRLAVTGRPQSDLARRARESAGVLDVKTGIEVSVATVKGYVAILYVLIVTAMWLGTRRSGLALAATLQQLRDDMTLVLPRHIRDLIGNEGRRQEIRAIARRCRDFNKVAVVGNSPITAEAELKVEELAQIVAMHLDFHVPSLRALIERSALVGQDSQRTLCVINATNAEAWQEARPLVSYLQQLGVYCVVHATPNALLADWRVQEAMAVVESPLVGGLLQPLIDVLFYFEFAVALAYERGLTPDEIDRPRSLAKSVTTTGAERRYRVEGRRDFANVDFATFNKTLRAERAWSDAAESPTRMALRATVALRSALATLNDAVPPTLTPTLAVEQLVVMTDTEGSENGAQMAAAAWQDLLGTTLVVYREFISHSRPHDAPDTGVLRFIRAGALLTVRDSETIALPADMSPLQLELLTALYLMGLATRRAHGKGGDTAAWTQALAQMPLVIDEMLGDATLAEAVAGALAGFVAAGYDKVQVIGGGLDHAGAASIARSLRMAGFMAEQLYVDSAWHGPLATVGGGDADHDTLVVILALDPLFQAAALVDTQVYRTRHAPVLLVVPQGNESKAAVQQVDATSVLTVPQVPRPLTGLTAGAFGAVLAREMNRLWDER